MMLRRVSMVVLKQQFECRVVKIFGGAKMLARNFEALEVCWSCSFVLIC